MRAQQKIVLEITAVGGARMLHDDAVDLRELGDVEVTRASHVEFDNKLKVWTVVSAKTGLLLNTFETRADALAWEKDYYSPTGRGWAELTGGN